MSDLAVVRERADDVKRAITPNARLFLATNGYWIEFNSPGELMNAAVLFFPDANGRTTAVQLKALIR